MQGRARARQRPRTLAGFLIAILAAVVGATTAAEGATPRRAAIEPAAPRANCSTTVANPLAQADELMADEYQLGPHAMVEIPFPPTWSEDPFGDRNWRSRFHGFEWFVSLVTATRETGEPRYLERALDLARSWLEANPREAPASDFSWKAQSTALRGQALECLARLAPGREWLEEGMRQHGAALADPAFYVRRGNHALNQNIGLLQIGCHLEREAWIDLAAARIDALLPQSIDADGVVNEQAIGYQLYNFERYSVAHAALVACGRPEPAAYGRVRRIPAYLAHATQPDGRYPQIGDTLDRRALVISGTTAAFAATAGAEGPKPDTEIDVYDRGYIFGRTGWGERRPFEDEAYFTLRFGEGRVQHGHDDQGSLTLYGFGSRLLLDPGLYAYEFDRWRDHFLSREAHNAVVVRGELSRWGRPAKLLRTRRDGRTFEATLEIGAYTPITHRRRVVFSRHLGYLLVEDRLAAAGRRGERFTQLWHLREGSVPELKGRTVRTRRARGNVVIHQLLPVDGTRVVAGRQRPLQGWLAYQYRDLQAAPVVEVHQRGRQARFLTLLVPVPNKGMRVHVSDLEVTPSGMSAVVRVGVKRERIVMTRGAARSSPAR